MSNAHFIHGELHAPYFIFLRCASEYSDAELLHFFSLSNYEPIDCNVQRYGPYAILADDGNWTLQLG